MIIYDQESKKKIKQTCLELGLALYFNDNEKFERLSKEIKKLKKEMDALVLKTMREELMSPSTKRPLDLSQKIE